MSGAELIPYSPEENSVVAERQKQSLLGALLLSGLRRSDILCKKGQNIVEVREVPLREAVPIVVEGEIEEEENSGWAVTDGFEGWKSRAKDAERRLKAALSSLKHADEDIFEMEEHLERLSVDAANLEKENKMLRDAIVRKVGLAETGTPSD